MVRGLKERRKEGGRDREFKKKKETKLHYARGPTAQDICELQALQTCTNEKKKVLLVHISIHSNPDGYLESGAE